METPPPPPEGSLLRRVRESAGISLTDAAKAAGITDTRWSQIERGHERRKGMDVPARAKAGTLARMARAIGIPPERLETDGQRPDAAEILREIEREPQSASLRAVPSGPPAAEGTTSEQLRDELLKRYKDDGVVQALGAQRGKKASTVVAEILEWLDWHPPGSPHANNGTAG